MCVKGYFDDYVLFWPIPHDAVRLPMAIRHTYRNLLQEASERRLMASIAAPARQLVGLEPLLEAQFKSGRQRIEELASQLQAGGNGKELVSPLRQWVDDFERDSEPHRDASHALNRAQEYISPLVLIVDDDEMQRLLVGEMLAEYLYRTVLAGGGIEALSVVRKTRPDIVLMDFLMPGMNGIDATRRILDGDYLPVIIMSARSEKALVIQCKEAGAADFLLKPFSQETLLAKLSHVLQEASEGRLTSINQPRGVGHYFS